MYFTECSLQYVGWFYAENCQSKKFYFSWVFSERVTYTPMYSTCIFEHLMFWGFIILHTNTIFKLLVLTGVTEDDCMRRMEVVYCVACDVHIPVVFSSVQQHLHSLTHLKSKVVTWHCPYFSKYHEPSFSSYIYGLFLILLVCFVSLPFQRLIRSS